MSGFFQQISSVHAAYPLLKDLPANHGNFDETGFELKSTGNETCFWIETKRVHHFMKARVVTIASGSAHVSGCFF